MKVLTLTQEKNKVISHMKKQKWLKDAEYYLLEHIEAKGCLWNPKDKNYFKNKIRKQAYSEIAEALGLEFPDLQHLTIGDVRAKFKSLRTYFMKEYRKYQTAKSDSNGNPTPKWQLFEAASFLMASVGDFPTESNWTESEIRQDTNVIEVESQLSTEDLTFSTPSTSRHSTIEEFSEDSNTSGELSWSETPCSSRKSLTGLTRKRKSESNNLELDNAVNNLIKVTKSKERKYTFASGVAIAVERTLDKLDTDDRYELSLQIFQLLKKFKPVPSESKDKCEKIKMEAEEQIVSVEGKSKTEFSEYTNVKHESLSNPQEPRDFQAESGGHAKQDQSDDNFELILFKSEHDCPKQEVDIEEEVDSIDYPIEFDYPQQPQLRREENTQSKNINHGKPKKSFGTGILPGVYTTYQQADERRTRLLFMESLIPEVMQSSEKQYKAFRKLLAEFLQNSGDM